MKLPKIGPKHFQLFFFIIALALIPLLMYFYVNLSKSPVKSQPAKTQPTPTLLPSKITIDCPVSAELCKNAKPIVFKGATIGIGFHVPVKTQIKTVFFFFLENGTESGGTFKIKSHPVRWLHGVDNFKGYIATYNFFADTVSSTGSDKNVKVFKLGEVIASSSDQSFPQEDPFNGVNFIFSVTQGDKFGQPVQVEFK